MLIYLRCDYDYFLIDDDARRSDDPVSEFVSLVDDLGDDIELLFFFDGRFSRLFFRTVVFGMGGLSDSFMDARIKYIALLHVYRLDPIVDDDCFQLLFDVLDTDDPRTFLLLGWHVLCRGAEVIEDRDDIEDELFDEVSPSSFCDAAWRFL